MIILTAYGSLESAISAIRAEVDGYLLKPVKPQEVREAVKRALERRKRLGGPATAVEKSVLEEGDFVVDLEQRVVTHNGQPMSLTPQEFRLLAHLVRTTPRAVPSQELVQTVRGQEAESVTEARRIIKWYIYRLRQQVEPDPSHPQHIITVRSVGYKFLG